MFAMSDFAKPPPKNVRYSLRLFVDTGSKVGIPLARFKLVHDVPEFIIGDTFFPSKAGEPRILEEPHWQTIEQWKRLGKLGITGIEME
ncbi:hypothetical protein AGMMS49940_09810 [Spirochaetia bacterium]|nr:hypothetical protein AGMMS49940_09810 [Spirochaetia bacterium]